MRVSMSPTGSLTATPRGRRAFGTITRRGRGASPPARSCRGAWGSRVVRAEPVDLVVLDLREHQLLLEAERVVAAPVEAALRDALEVADPWERNRDELLEEVPHLRSAQRDLEPDRHADPEPEVRDGLARLR